MNFVQDVKTNPSFPDEHTCRCGGILQVLSIHLSKNGYATWQIGFLQDVYPLKEQWLCYFFNKLTRTASISSVYPTLKKAIFPVWSISI